MRVAKAMVSEILAPRIGAVVPTYLFGLPPDPSTEELGKIPQSVVSGFHMAFQTSSDHELHQVLSLVDPLYRGFAYEGATMGCAVLDVMTNRQAERTAGVMAGPGEPHLLLNFIGLGFAMARLPRPLWKVILPQLPPTPLNPRMNWLVVDGYGFDLAYFNADRYLRDLKQPKPYPWQGEPEYFLRVVDQGIGRAMWFANGADPDATAHHIARFPVERRRDLWSGVGLAATFAGPTIRAQELPRLAGGNESSLAVGALFAHQGRRMAGYEPQGCVDTLHALTGLTTQEADALIDAFQPRSGPAFGSTSPGRHLERRPPEYELWRLHLAAQFTQVGEPATPKN